jgi:hypothetical protein
MAKLSHHLLKIELIQIGGLRYTSTDYKYSYIWVHCQQVIGWL